MNALTQIRNLNTSAYIAGTPWGQIGGTEVSENVTPAQMLVRAGLDWNAVKAQTYFRDPNTQEYKPTGKHALIRSDTGTVLSPNLSANWQPVQNSAALGFFDEFCRAGEMKMERAGTLGDGRYVYAYARIDANFELPGQDRVGAYLLFLNPQRVGHSINLFLSPVRFFCMNQLPRLLKSNSGHFRCIHTAKFDPEAAKIALGLSKKIFSEYEWAARFLTRKRFTESQLVEYFNRVFPNAANDDGEVVGQSRRAMLCVANLESQPGAQASEGSWWHAFNTVTYVTDHVIGRSADTRQANALFGWTRQRKIEALGIALEMARAA